MASTKTILFACIILTSLQHALSATTSFGSTFGDLNSKIWSTNKDLFKVGLDGYNNNLGLKSGILTSSGKGVDNVRNIATQGTSTLFGWLSDGTKNGIDIPLSLVSTGLGGGGSIVAASGKIGSVAGDKALSYFDKAGSITNSASSKVSEVVESKVSEAEKVVDSKVESMTGTKV